MKSLIKMEQQQQALSRGKFTLDEAIAHAETCAKGISGCCAENHRQLAEWLKDLRTRKLRDEVVTKCKAERDFSTQFALDQHYDRAMGCLEDAKFVCTEKEYYGINALVHQTISELEAIGELAGIKEKPEGKNTRVTPKVNTPKGEDEDSAEEKKLPQLGNNAEMRNALGSVRNWCINALAGDRVSVQGLLEWVEKVLAKPPRNCDVGTAEEQYK